MRAKQTKSASTASEPASEPTIPEKTEAFIQSQRHDTEVSGDYGGEVALSDEPVFAGLYRSSRGGMCCVIGFATEVETNETVVAFIAIDGKHYTMKIRVWLSPSRTAPDQKRFTRIKSEDVR